ncbi:Protein yippee-like [Hibiscus syriacus]|uniref:Protein yippee-like n=1 Tax=Hibiscus syriacus TaxID=106335 RepID=A0A6A2WQR1_HIBSY|nr:protein yippee-like [Hibiscus syriacus]KAE8662341.1 Protein yippee-like [Hibiscus syriacus]
MMMTGMHTVVDIFCVGCGSIVGWKYESAHEKTQKYKEGKFILERFKVLGPDGSNYTVSHEAVVRAVILILPNVLIVHSLHLM